ncbi:MAG: sulfite exporter TauE/SafE family protein [Chloroflexi bacterium]|nr:sulfite exporter TauE/SafE family protein [Chloroflexota bacterium]
MGDLVQLALIGLAAGFLAGLLGIGGGVLMVPAMVLLLGFDQHVAQGTSLMVVIPAALTGSYTHHRNGRLFLRDAAILAAGGVVGAVIGAVFALSIDDDILRRLFAGFLLVIAVRMLLPKGLFRRESKG